MPASIPAFLQSTGKWIQVGETLGRTIPASPPPDDLILREHLLLALEDPEQILGPTDSFQLSAHLGDTPYAQKRTGAIVDLTEISSGRDFLAATIGRLWLAGASIDWQRYYSAGRRCRIPLPTSPFERFRYSLEDILPEDLAQIPLTLTVADSNPSKEYAAPQTDLQSVIASIWSFYLGTERVGIDDSFFDLGGNSIIATRIVSALRNSLQIDLPLRSLLENKPTVRSLSDSITRMAAEWELDINDIARVVREIQTSPSQLDIIADETIATVSDRQQGAAILASDAGQS